MAADRARKSVVGTRLWGELYSLDLLGPSVVLLRGLRGDDLIERVEC